MRANNPEKEIVEGSELSLMSFPLCPHHPLGCQHLAKNRPGLLQSGQREGGYCYPIHMYEGKGRGELSV